MFHSISRSKKTLTLVGPSLFASSSQQTQAALGILDLDAYIEGSNSAEGSGVLDQPVGDAELMDDDQGEGLCDKSAPAR